MAPLRSLTIIKSLCHQRSLNHNQNKVHQSRAGRHHHDCISPVMRLVADSGRPSYTDLLESCQITDNT